MLFDIPNHIVKIEVILQQNIQLRETTIVFITNFAIIQRSVEMIILNNK